MKKLIDRIERGLLYLSLKLTRRLLEKEMKPYEGQKVPYGEIVGAPYPYNLQGELTYGEPDLDMMDDILFDVAKYLKYWDDCRKPTEGNLFETEEDTGDEKF